MPRPYNPKDDPVQQVPLGLKMLVVAQIILGIAGLLLRYFNII